MNIKNEIYVMKLIIEHSRKMIVKEENSILRAKKEIEKLQSKCKHDFEYKGVQECKICSFVGGI